MRNEPYYVGGLREEIGEAEAEIERLRALNAKLVAACEVGLRYHEAIEAMDPCPWTVEPEGTWERNAALYREWHAKTADALRHL